MIDGTCALSETSRIVFWVILLSESSAELGWSLIFTTYLMQNFTENIFFLKIKIFLKNGQGMNLCWKLLCLLFVRKIAEVQPNRKISLSLLTYNHIGQQLQPEVFRSIPLIRDFKSQNIRTSFFLDRLLSHTRSSQSLWWNKASKKIGLRAVKISIYPLGASRNFPNGRL